MSAEARQWLAYARENRQETIFLPSKYPLGSVLPAFEPDARIARHCLTIVDRVLAAAASVIPAQ